MTRFVVRFIQSPRAACLSVLPPRALAICRKALINSNLRAELQDSPSFEARFLSCRINCQSGIWKNQASFDPFNSYNFGKEALNLNCSGQNWNTYTQQGQQRSEEHTSELKSLMRISYSVFCLKK